MEKSFKVQVSKDRLQAYLDILIPVNNAPDFTLEELDAFLKKQRIVYGINKEQLIHICSNPKAIKYPVCIAEGKPVIHGEGAYLQNEIQVSENVQKEKLNFRDVLNIPSVKNGQLIATIVPPTQGVDGIDVYGRRLVARNGKPLRIRPGKNVTLQGNQFFSTDNGQLSVTENRISVNPVFEVNGDIDLKTGNINFIGTVIIRGDVPSGYEIKAGGDLQIRGIVEGAYLEAGGNITVRGGITGGKRGRVIAGGNIQAAYLNQANVRAGQSVIIESSLLHSEVQAMDSIICQNGPIIGGRLVAGKDIKAKEIGNRLFTKTDLFIGTNPLLEDKEQRLLEEKKSITDNLKKLEILEHKLTETIKHVGRITEEHKVMLQKQKATKQQLEANLKEINEQLMLIAEGKELNATASVTVTDTVFPNTTIHFGKYSRIIQKKHTFTRFNILNGDIQFEPIG